MTYKEIIENIRNIAKSNNLMEVIDEIDKRIKWGSTGMEINGMIGKYLYDLKEERPTIYLLLESEIIAFNNLNAKNGLIIR